MRGLITLVRHFFKGDSSREIISSVGHGKSFVILLTVVFVTYLQLNDIRAISFTVGQFNSQIIIISEQSYNLIYLLN